MKTVMPIKSSEFSFTAPAAKAYTLRALILASISSGETVITRPLLGEDQLNLIKSLKNLGVIIKQNGINLIVEGCNGVFKPINNKINVGESGVAMNFLSSLAAICDSEIVLTGSPGLLKRPVKEVVDGVRQWGAKIEYIDNEGYPPLKITPSKLSGGDTKLFGAKNSQYFSSLVITAALTNGNSRILCMDEMSEKPYFDITREMMEHFGVKSNNENYKVISVESGQKYKSNDITVEGDYSSASFFFQAAAVTKSKVTVSGLNPDSLQGDKKYIDFMRQMGAEVNIENDKVSITGKDLKSIEVDMEDTPDLAPPLAVAAAFAEGTTKLTKVGRLRYKECDRLEAISSNLIKMGVNCYYDDDNLYIEGTKNIKGATIDCFNDHRIAMSFAIAGLAVEGQIIEDEACVAKSFPNFWTEMKNFNQ